MRAMSSRPRYRTRIWLREHLPEPVARFFPPGRRDCGEHEWFRVDEATDRCWHCTTERPHQPTPIDPDGDVWKALRQAAREGDPVSRRIVLRMMAEHEAYEAGVVRDMEETATQLNVDASGFKRQAASVEETSRSLAAALE